MEVLTMLEVLGWFGLALLCGIVGINVKQVYRPFLLACLFCFALLSLRNISDDKLGLSGTETMAIFILIYLSHITSVLCVEQYVLPKTPGKLINWREGYRMQFNARWLGTHRMAPDVKAVTAVPATVAAEKSAAEPPNKLVKMLSSPRARFLANRVASAFTIWAIGQAYNYAFFSIAPKYGMVLEMTDFLPTKLSYWRRLPEVTLRETMVRFWITTYWTGFSVCIYTFIHDVLAFIFVAIRLDAPEDWPPLFGDVRQATSMRNFWGKFWHRLVYRAYTSYGVFLVKNILRLPKDSVLGKYIVNLTVFMISGFVHAAVVWRLGFTCGIWEEVYFYWHSFVAVVAEMLVLLAWNKLTRGYKLNKTVSNVVGYTWVAAFLFTVIPKAQFPKVWCIPGAEMS